VQKGQRARRVKTAAPFLRLGQLPLAQKKQLWYTDKKPMRPRPKKAGAARKQREREE